MLKAAKNRARQAAAGAVIKQAEKAARNGELDDVKQEATRLGADGFFADDRAQMSNGADKAVNLVVALVVGGLMAAFLLPIAIDEISTVDTSSWDNGAAALWNILPVMVVLAIFLFFTYMAVSRRR